MARLLHRAFLAAGLLVAALSTGVSVRVWRGEQLFAAGAAAQRRGDLNAAAAAYRAAASNGNTDAAIERARLELLRRDWDGSGKSLREAMALAPMRGFPHVLLAAREVERPGAWDSAREERVLDSCRIAVALEPARAGTRRECASIVLRLAVLRRTSWDPARSRAVLSEAADGYVVALAYEPKVARNLFDRMLADGGDSTFLVDVASRQSDAAGLSALVGALLDHPFWERDEPGIWAAVEARGILPAFSAAAADVLARRSRFREAVEATRRGLLAAPGDAALALRAADITARLPGREALAAVPLYRGIVAADPGNTAVRRRFAAFLSARDLLSEAEEEARSVVGADPKDAETWFLLGQILRRRGRAGEATDAYRAAAELRPKNSAYRRAADGG